MFDEAINNCMALHIYTSFYSCSLRSMGVLQNICSSRSNRHCEICKISNRLQTLKFIERQNKSMARVSATMWLLLGGWILKTFWNITIYYNILKDNPRLVMTAFYNHPLWLNTDLSLLNMIVWNGTTLYHFQIANLNLTAAFGVLGSFLKISFFQCLPFLGLSINLLRGAMVKIKIETWNF